MTGLENRIFVLVLGLWFALAPALYIAPAAGMMAQAGISYESSSSVCDGCTEHANDHGNCAVICFNAGHFATGVEPTMLKISSGGNYNPGGQRYFLATAQMPDPAPPKPSSFR